MDNNLKKLNEIGIALSTEKDITNLLELIVDEAMNITNADGATLYQIIDHNTRLKFEISKNITLGWNFVGMSEEKFYPVKLYDLETGEPNKSNVSAYCALTGETVNVEDAYNEKGFDFSGLKGFDKKVSYKSVSLLNVPLKDHENNILGVLQLVNSIDEKTKKIIPFEKSVVKLIESITSQAAVALNNTILIKTLENILKSLIQYTVKAIDSKTHHTAGHSSRVAKLTRKMAESINEINKGPYKSINYSKDELEEIWIAGLMHDVGKIGTPEHILDKKNKIDGSKFEIVENRFKYIKSIYKLTLDEKLINDKIKEIDSDFAQVKSVNEQGYISKEQKKDLDIIFKKTYFDGFSDKKYLTDEEFDCLLIEKGNLTKSERKIMQDHILHTENLLNRLQFPEKLKNVPIYANAHHENMDGKGYPNGLDGDKIPLPARMMAITDVWDAVTAQDRPYRPPVPYEIACKIIREEAENGKLDKELVELFIDKEIGKNKSRAK